MTFGNALSSQVIKDFLAFTFYRTSNPDTDMILSIIPSNCTITIMLAFIGLLVQSLMVFALVLEFWKSGWTAFFI